MSPILNLYQKTLESSACFRPDVVAINIVNPSIPTFLWSANVVVFGNSVSPIVPKARFVKIVSKIMQALDGREDQSTSSNVIHTRQLHFGKTLELAKYGRPSLVPLRHYDALVACPRSENGLKGIQYRSVCGSPFIYNLKIFVCSASISNICSSARDSRLRTARKAIFLVVSQFRSSTKITRTIVGVA